MAKNCSCWKGYERVHGTKPCAPNSCRKIRGKKRKAQDFEEFKRKGRGKDKRKRCPKGMRMQEDGCQTISKYDYYSKERIRKEADEIHRKNMRNPILRLMGYRDFMEIQKSNKPGKKWKTTIDGKTYHGGDSNYTIAPGTKRGDAYCARSSGIKMTPRNRMARKKWKCKGKKSMK